MQRDSRGRYVRGHKPEGRGGIAKVCQFCGEKCGTRIKRGCRLRRISYATSSRRKKWGWTADRVRERLVVQEGRCAICGIELGSTTRGANADHDHATGQPRALLCGSCNTGLGAFSDDPERLRRAAGYIEDWAKDRARHGS